MELSGVFALALVSFVTGTPHGYGVKSGAVAKAEASAVAGTFGVHPAIPLSIPSGTGFSGSYSKSSSSSFASASSSASSSSSSYTFSGSGTNGIPGFGCQTNNCKHGGNSAPTTLHSSSDNAAQNNGGVIHGNGAGAGVISYSNNGGTTPCVGNHCNGYSNTNNKCSTGDCNGVTGNQQDVYNGLPSSNANYNIGTNCASGQCNTELQNGKPQNGYDSPNKCISGNCSPSSQQHTDSASNSYDYDVDSTSKTQPKSTYETNGDSPNFNSNSGSSHTQSPCSQGKCGSGPSSSMTSPSSEHDIFIPLSPSGNEARPTYPKPDTHLNTPNLVPACTSHSCSIPPSGPDSINGKLPTSYNVPILGTNPTLSGHDTNSNPTPNLYNLPKSSISNCGSARCPTVSATPVNGNYPSELPVAPAASCTGTNCESLNAPDSEIPTNQVQTNKPSNCKTSDCDYYPAFGHSASGYPSTPSYTGAPSPSGSFIVPIPTSKVDPTHYPNIFPGYEGAPVKPGSVSSISNVSPINGAGGFSKPTEVEPLGPSKPHFDVSSTTQNTPLYTGGFGGSPGSFDTGSTIGTKFTLKPTHNKAPSSNLPHGNGIGSTTGSTGENSGSNSYPGLHDLSKPSGGLVPPHQNIPTGPGSAGESHGPSTVFPNLPKPTEDKTTLPQYTGGFGGSSGSFDTGSASGTQFSSTPSHENIPSTSNLPHTSGSGSTGPAGANSGSNSYPGSHGLSKPSGSLVPPHQNIPAGPGSFAPSHEPSTVFPNLPKPVNDKTKLPQYTGGFGGSPGSFDTGSATGTQFASKPSHENVPSTSNLPHTSGGGLTDSAGANSGSHSYPGSHGVVLPNQNIPTGPGTFAESHGPTTILQTGSTSLSKPIDKTKLPQYTGGFGGPTGILKPNEQGIPKTPASSSNNYSPTSCTSGNCNSKDVSTISGAHQKTNGLSGISSTSADAKAIAYSGGFGGPSGFLKPFDDGKSSKSENYGNEGKDQSANRPTSDFNQGNTDALSNAGANTITGAQAIAGAQAFAGAQASAGAQANAFASSGAFSANQGAGTGCKTGCETNYNPGTGHNFATSRSLGISQAGGFGDVHNNGAAAVASAKSIAGAGSGVFGAGFASSSASAHSSAGAAVKGGYGR